MRTLWFVILLNGVLSLQNGVNLQPSYYNNGKNFNNFNVYYLTVIQAMLHLDGMS
jgi:hypothetical protein